MLSDRAEFKSLSRPLETTIQVGMPQLGLNGLSENWLLKESGHRHWSAICERAGVQSHQIVDGQGHRLYAAFVGIEWEGDALGRVGENDVLHVKTELTRFSSKRFFSNNVFHAASGASLRVRMVSIFVRKPIFDDNRSISGGSPDPLRRVPQEESPADATELLARWKTEKGTPPPDNIHKIAHHSVCPTTEFNGARLLYFANFQRILDQAEWRALPQDDMQFASTERRQLMFYGNVNFEDILEIRFRDVNWQGAVRSHVADVLRAKDRVRLAVMETRKHIAHLEPGWDGSKITSD